MSAMGKTALSRADLLKMLVLQDSQALEKTAWVLGYQLEEKKPAKARKENLTEAETTETPAKAAFVSKPIQRPDNKLAANFFYVAERSRKENDQAPSKPEVPAHIQQGNILLEDACAQPASLVLPRYSPLIRWPRLWPFLRTVLGQHYASRKPNIPRLINDIARGVTLRQLPMQTLHGWSAHCCLLLDINPRTEAYSLDFSDLQTRLKKMHGALGLDVRILEGEAGLLTHYRKASQNEVLNWDIPTSDAPVLILSDLGLLAESAHIKQGWQRFGRRLRAAGCKPHVLCPVPEALITQNLQQLFTIHSWDKSSRLQERHTPFLRHDGSDNDPLNQTKGVETLLALLSIAVVIEPGLLRAVRNLFTVEQINVADEAGFWQHADISSSTQGCCFKSLAAVNLYQQQLPKDDFWHDLKDQTPTEQQLFKIRLVTIIQQHHAYLPQSVRMMELDQCQHILPRTLDQQTQADIQHWKQSMARTCYQQADHQDLQAWNQQYISSLPGIMLNNPYIAVLWACAQKQKLEQGEIIHYPDEIDSTDVEFILTGVSDNNSLPCRLFQVGNELKISEQNTETALLSSYYTGLVLDGDLCIQIEDQHSQVSEGRWQWQNSTDEFKQGNSKMVAQLEQSMRKLSLSNNHETLVIKSLTKPDWASQIGRDPEGLWLEFEQQGQQWRVYWPAWGGELGYDQYGLYNDLNIKGVIQRSRFIVPGTFQMGSPKSEKERREDEVQHPVTLSQGYWLADTACTQALWQAIMGENPANFTENENNPVEQVSWEDVQIFLQKINHLIPGLEAKLPTEAQWEYACRAGTDTPFSFGQNITPEQVNYEGGYPYADGKKGLSRETTVPVKSLPENAWGLYEMHGNILEWCQDWYGDYVNTAITDPVGVEDGISRVLRGGSWFDLGGSARSAGRNMLEPDDRGSNVGFRFAPGQV